MWMRPRGKKRESEVINQLVIVSYKKKKGVRLGRRIYDIILYYDCGLANSNIYTPNVIYPHFGHHPQFHIISIQKCVIVVPC